MKSNIAHHSSLDSCSVVMPCVTDGFWVVWERTEEILTILHFPAFLGKVKISHPGIYFRERNMSNFVCD